MEEQIFFHSGDVKIEGLLDLRDGEKAVAVTHPHPLYGGNMQNNVVESVLNAYGRNGYTTLRFNFRGSGASEGVHENGIGEREDVRAALDFLRESGKSAIDLAGYSFGAWVNAQAIDDKIEIDRMIMVSPPVHFMDFSSVDHCPGLRIVVTGSRDDIAPPDMIAEILPRWNRQAVLRIIEGADHFYLNQTDEIERIIGEFLGHRGTVHG
jgi:alpha/beta superfamily hydrolase